MHFCPIVPKANFKRTSIPSTLSRLQFGTKRFHPKGGPWRKALETHFSSIAPKAIFPDPNIIHFEPLTVFNKTVSS